MSHSHYMKTEHSYFRILAHLEDKLMSIYRHPTGSASDYSFLGNYAIGDIAQLIHALGAAQRWLEGTEDYREFQ